MEFADLLNSEDFREKRPSVYIYNDTSRTEFLDNQLFGLIEIGEKEAIIEMPKNSCAPGHSLVIYFFLDDKPRKLSRLPDGGEIEGAVRVRSKITGITKEDQATFVNLEFTQYSKPEWLGFLEELVRLPRQNYETVKKMRQM